MNYNNTMDVISMCYVRQVMCLLGFIRTSAYQNGFKVSVVSTVFGELLKLSHKTALNLLTLVKYFFIINKKRQ